MIIDILLNIPFFTSEKEEIKECKEDEELKNIKEKAILASIILERYRDLIEEKEEKSVSALKYLINPDNKFIKSKVEEIKNSLKEFSTELAIQSTIEYVQSIKTVRWPVSFWLSFEDIDKYKVGDDMDKSIFLCSLLRALGVEEIQILVASNKQSYILYTLDENYKLLECEKGIIEEGKKSEILKSKNFIYAFNDKEYEDLSDSND